MCLPVIGLIFANIALSYFTGNYCHGNGQYTCGIYNLDIFGAYGKAINKRHYQ